MELEGLYPTQKYEKPTPVGAGRAFLVASYSKKLHGHPVPNPSAQFRAESVTPFLYRRLRQRSVANYSNCSNGMALCCVCTWSN